MPVLIEPREPNPHVERVLREGRLARLAYEETRGKGEREVLKRLCPNCEREVEPCRVWLGSQTCAACATYKEVIRP